MTGVTTICSDALFLKEFGLNFTYTPVTNIHRSKVAKHHNEKAKKAEKKQQEKKANEATPVAASNPSISTSNTNSIPRTSVQAGRDTANPFVTIGKGGSKTTPEAEAKYTEKTILLVKLRHVKMKPMN